MEFGLTKMSTKGQIVIHTNLRKEFKTGDEFLVVRDEGRLILKKMQDVAKDIKEDLKFAEEIEEAYKK